MIKSIIFTLLFVLMFHLGKSETVSKTLYVNKGLYTAIDSSQFPFEAFNSSASFIAENTRLIIDVNDSLMLTIINTDSVAHGFAIKDYLELSEPIMPGDTFYAKCSFSTPGIHLYFDNVNYPNNTYMGLAGMIVVTNDNYPRFFWNIKEHEKELTTRVSNGESPTFENYNPDFFTINGNSNPNINLDSNARVSGIVGDTIRIYIANTGQSIHSIHFHGYHFTVVSSTKFPSHKGRSKDTFPIYSMEGLILELIPDQPGEYPVHDHNLSAVSGGKHYPNGMFLTMLIE
ncbi:MAG: FtsP/CotA-like multicopper oxidase with cupredoxin domain [Flavobacteriales bacterium]|jgi:FtsP/CotA-like multicopper oxidase with cupredoxin domain